MTMNFCTNCGAKLEANEKFCPTCGEKISTATNYDATPYQPDSGLWAQSVRTATAVTRSEGKH